MLPVWGAYIWRGLYMEGLIFVYGISRITGLPLFTDHEKYVVSFTIHGNQK